MRNKLRSIVRIFAIAVIIGVGFGAGLTLVRLVSEKHGNIYSDRAEFPWRLARASGNEQDLALRRTPVVIALEKVRPSVVNINTEKIVERSMNPFGGMRDEFSDKFFQDFFGDFPTQKYKQQSLGSGVIIDPKGYILTNEHVVLRASEIKVTLTDERELPAKVIGADPRFDLAILRVESKKDLPAARTGDSDAIMIGETVIAIGNPFGLHQTVTTGVVSAIDRSIKTSEGKEFHDFIQTDASINPGNSGGPLINIVGEVIGINTAIYAGAEGIGFAIPINRAMRAVADLIRFGKIERTWSGIRIQELTRQLANRLNIQDGRGVLVSDIIESSPASKAGLKTGDIIVKIDSTDIASPDDFSSKISGYLVGDNATIEVLRDEKRLPLKVKFSALPLEKADRVARSLFGVEVDKIDGSAISKYRLRSNAGVVVTSVVDNSPAARIGMQPGDIIRQLGTKEIKSMDDFREAAILASVEESVFLVVQRGVYLYNVRI